METGNTSHRSAMAGMNDGMGVYRRGLSREVWEGEALFTAITLALWEVEVCLSCCILFLCVNLCLFEHLCLVHCLSLSLLFSFFSSYLLLVVFLTFSPSFINSLCLHLSSCVFPLVSAYHSPLLTLLCSCFKRCEG